jgi:xanthine dehydrogenase accessory factor
VTRELREIAVRLDQLEPGTDAVLATVIDVRGSGYRLPGARMLILENGDTFGTVSGGCLEADVLERAKNVLKSGRAEVFTYDTTADENSVFSLNMGCRGVIRILLEPIGPKSELTSLIASASTDRESYSIATFIGGDTKSCLKVGERLFVGNHDALPNSRDSCAKAIPGIVDDLMTFHESSGAYETIRYVTDDGEAEFAFETLKPPVLVAIFGAGADAVPVAKSAYDLGWQVDVFDHRPAFLTRERFPDANELTQFDRDDSNFALATDDLTAIVSMNHNYDRDRETLNFALTTNAFYVGMLGPKKRTEEMLDELRDRGEVFNSDALSKLRYPAGLDIGGDSPESIAVSIIAEIQSVLKHRSGGPLRDRTGSIYDRKQQA